MHFAGINIFICFSCNCFFYFTQLSLVFNFGEFSIAIGNFAGIILPVLHIVIGIEVGDSLLTNHRRPILAVLEDTSGGIHDTLMAACDRYRYEELGCAGYHDNCTDNLAQSLAELGLTPPETPCPLNLFMNIPWTAAGELSFDPPVSTPGCYIRLRAAVDLVIVFSACPQDILPINGRAGRPTEAHYLIEG